MLPKEDRVSLLEPIRVRTRDGRILPTPPWTAERIEASVIPEPMSGCWLWLGRLDRNGYGRAWTKKVVQANRLSYEVYNGPIPKGLFVCHRCDNPICVNPDHLYAGTPLQNTRDWLRRGSLKDRRPVSAGAPPNHSAAPA